MKEAAKKGILFFAGIFVGVIISTGNETFAQQKEIEKKNTGQVGLNVEESIILRIPQNNYKKIFQNNEGEELKSRYQIEPKLLDEKTGIIRMPIMRENSMMTNPKKKMKINLGDENTFRDSAKCESELEACNAQLDTCCQRCK